MGEAVQIQFDTIPSFLGAPVGDLEDLVPDQVAMAGYFCDNLANPTKGPLPALGQRYLARQLRYASIPGEAPANVIDLGDVNVFPLEPEKHFSALTSQCEAVLKTGARMVLVGGDSSGLKVLSKVAQKIVGADVSIVPVRKGVADNLSRTRPVILSVDLQELAANWVSQPRRLTGLSPAQMIAQIETMSGNIVAAAIFGLAPALDNRGRTETKAAFAILQAVFERLAKGAN